jgi:hypothetical protein
MNNDDFNSIRETDWRDFKLGDKVGISLSAAAWAMVLESLSSLDDKTPALIGLGNEIWEHLTTEAYRKAIEARHTQNNSFIERLRASGVPDMFIPDELKGQNIDPTDFTG